MDPVILAKYNAEIRNWGRQTSNSLKSKVAVNSGLLMQSIKPGYSKNEGAISKISQKFLRYGVFVEKGASRGHGGKKGSSWYNEKGERVFTNKASLNKMNSGGKKSNPWYNETIDQRMPVLADIVSRNLADATVKATKI